MNRETPLANLISVCADRPPDWRWRRAGALLDRSKSVTPRIEEPRVCECAQFMRKLRGGATHDELAAHNRAFYEAYRVFTESHTSRWLLEALVMSDEPAERIAERFGWVGDSAAVVPIYEECFFDVRNRLGRQAWVLSTLIDAGAIHAGSAPDPVVWKLVAWHGYRAGVGAEMLDAYVDAGPMADRVRAWLADSTLAQLARRAARTSLRLSGIDAPEFSVDLIRASVEIERVDAEKRAARGQLPEGDGAKRASILAGLKMTMADVESAKARTIEPRAADVLAADIARRLAALPPTLSSAGTETRARTKADSD